MMEESKPPLPATRAPKHFLLVTPFRYMPAHESRFRRVGRRGIWDGALDLKAACAEVGRWRMRFILDSAGLAEKRVVTRHAFLAAAVVRRGVDLIASPWRALHPAWTTEGYGETQRLAEEAESAGIELVCYKSVRLSGAACVAVFTLDTLEGPAGGLDATRERVMMHTETGKALRFEWEAELPSV